MADGYILSEADMEKLKTLWRERESVDRSRPDKEDREFEGPAAEFYVALTPAGGIPAVTSDRANFAVCEVYSVEESTEDSNSTCQILPVDGLNHRVFNVTGNSVPANSWIHVAKDKYGVWHAIVGGSSGTLARCTGRKDRDDANYPGSLVRWESGVLTDTTPCLLVPLIGTKTLMPGQYYTVSSVGANGANGLPIYLAHNQNHKIYVQLVKRIDNSTYPTYYGLRVLLSDPAAISQALVGPLIYPIYNVQNNFLPTCPPPSPQFSSSGVVEQELYTGTGTGNVGWDVDSESKALGAETAGATVTLLATETSEWLRFRAFDFLVPETIGGEAVELLTLDTEFVLSADKAGIVLDDVRIFYNGFPISSNQATNNVVNITETVIEISKTLAQWNCFPELSPLMLNNNSFTIGIRLRNTNTDPEDPTHTCTATVDYCSVEVTFDPEGTFEPRAVFEVEESTDGSGAWFFSAHPHWEFTVDTDESEVVGSLTYGVTYERIWDQEAKTWVSKRESRSLPVF